MPEESQAGAAGIITKVSPHPVRETVRAFTDLAQERGLNIFIVIDQQDEARRVGLDLRETTVVEFGNPSAGTPIMAADPLTALDLPLKIVVWSDGGETKVSYYAPEAIADRHGLDHTAVVKFASINALTDAVTEN